MAAVEFVESGELDLDVEVDADDGGAPAPRARGWRRIHRVWPFALVAVVVAGVYVMAAARESARVEARTALLLSQGGYISGLGPEMGLAWTLDDVQGKGYVGWVDETLVLQGTEEGLFAVDLGTGDTRWQVPIEADDLYHCWEDAEGPDGTMLLCGRYSLAGSQEDGIYPFGYVIEQRDAATGELLASRETDGHLSVSWWGNDLLVLDEADGTLELRLESLEGEVRWALPVPGPTTSDTAAWVDPSADMAILRGARHLAVDRDGQVLFERPTSAEHDPTDPGGFIEYLSTMREGFVLSRYGGEQSSVAIFDEHGALQLDTEGYLASPMADDGSAPGLVVTQPLWGLAVWDRVTAQTVLEIDGQPESLLLILHGALIYQRDGELRAVDLSTGTERWQTEMRQSEILGTDGEVLVIDDRLSHGRLRGISAHTGTDLWEYPLPNLDTSAFVAGGALLLDDGQRLMRLTSE